MKAYLVQHGSDKCAAYLQLTAPLHREYARQFGFEFIEHYEKVDPSPFSKNSEGQVWFFNLLNSLPEGAFAAYADADVIIKKKVDLREGLVGGNVLSLLGSHSFGWLNCGVIFVCNTTKVRNFFSTLSKNVDPEYNLIDVNMNKMLPTSGLNYSFFSHKWNFFPTYGGGVRGCTLDCTEEEAVIRAWHGFDAETVVSELSKTIQGMAA